MLFGYKKKNPQPRRYSDWGFFYFSITSPENLPDIHRQELFSIDASALLLAGTLSAENS